MADEGVEKGVGEGVVKGVDRVLIGDGDARDLPLPVLVLVVPFVVQCVKVCGVLGVDGVEVFDEEGVTGAEEEVEEEVGVGGHGVPAGGESGDCAVSTLRSPLAILARWRGVLD